MQKPFFSVVIPTLNEEKYLPKLLNDLAKQTFKNFDVWVVDAHSDDKTQTVVKEFEKTHSNFHVVDIKTRHVSVQRNTGARKSTGSHLMFFDADTRLKPTFLQAIHDNLEKNPVDMWTNYAAPETRDAKDRLFVNILNVMMEAGANSSYPVAPGACIGCTREVFETIGGFDENVTISEDILFFHTGVEYGFVSELYKDPRFVFCTRRQRKDGYLSLSAKVVPIVIQTLQGKKFKRPIDDYPMLGGSYFEKHKQDKKVSVNITKYYDRFRRAIRKQEKELKQELKEVFGEY
jgi:glycosyltransferase involved in cell wall biosynthesis